MLVMAIARAPVIRRTSLAKKPIRRETERSRKAWDLEVVVAVAAIWR